MLAPGTTFAGDYKVERPLSAGGMGSIYVVDQLSTGRKRALKLMHPDLVRDPKLRERFVQEAKVGARIDSEHVIEVIAAGVDALSQAPYLVMELLQGETLEDYVERRGPLPGAEVRDLFRQLCHALGAAHAASIVHRDIKPENVFLSQSRRADVRFTVKVLDFGIAKLVAEAMTSSTAAMGTPLWMAPEQTDPHAKISPATDVWALGLVAFYCLTGKPFWVRAQGSVSVQALMREVLLEPMESASARAKKLGLPPLPEGFDAWFARAVDRESTERFADATEAFRALEPLLEAPAAIGSTVAAAPLTAAMAEPRSSERSRKPKPKTDTVTDVSVTVPAKPVGPIPPPPASKDRSSRTPLFVAAGLIGLMGVGITALVVSGAEDKPVAQNEEREERKERDRSGGPWQQEGVLPVSSDDPQIGSRNAPVTLVVFSDFQCPYCSKVGTMLHELRSKYGDYLRVVWRDKPLDFHQHARPAALLAREAFLAKGHEAFWKVHDHLFEAQRDLSDMDALEGWVAKELDVDRSALTRRKSEAEKQVDESIALANKLGVTGTPQIFVNGIRVVGARPVEEFEKIIEAELKAVESAKAQGLDEADVYVDRVKKNYDPAKGEEPADEPAKERETPLFADVSAGQSPYLGPADAPVTIIEFAEFQCPYCKRIGPTLKALLAKYPQDVKLVYKHFPLPLHKRAVPAANLAIEAFKAKGAPGFWAAQDALYAAPSLEDPSLEKIAASLGLPGAMACVASSCNQAAIDANHKEGTDAGVGGIPAVFINGRFITGAFPQETFEAVVRWELEKFDQHMAGGGGRAEYPAKAAALARKLAGVRMLAGSYGGKPVLPRSKVRAHWVGKLDDGTVFDSTRERGSPAEITLVPGRMIPGFEEAIVGMDVGSKRTITIPPEAGYGAAGRPPTIPANATLTFEIEIVRAE